MNFKTLFFIFFFGLTSLMTTSFAQESVLQEKDVYQGTTETFYIQSQFGAPQPIDPPVEGNSVVLTSVVGNIFGYEYTPDPSFLGADGFSYEVITGLPPNISTLKHVFQIDVIASMVNSHDDFVHLNSLDEVTIDPLINDETSSPNLTITLAHVLKGTATVNEDLTISYTPIDETPDYIIYTVSDDFNTISSATIYISQESDLEVGETVKEYKIASGNSQLIILPSEELTLVDETYVNGSVEQINSFVYEYQANANLEGSDDVNFVDVDGNTYQASISILEKYLDEGYVRDDIFFSASNTNIVFDVKLNDIDEHSIADYSSELLHLGNGVFSFTPLPYFTGTKEFFYTAYDGFNEETGTIELVFNNFKPTNYFEYNLSTPKNQPRVIEYEVPLGTEYFEIASLPTYGTVEIFTETESVDVGCEEGIQKVFAVYTPDAGYIGIDDMTIKYCASDNNVCNDVNIAFDVVDSDIDECICVDDCVWAGDTNGDGKVSVIDALSIARFMGSGGTPRDDSPFGAAYEGASAEDWTVDQANGKNLKHADTNGDGMITIEDLDVVVDNYGDINAIISEDILGVKNVPFLLSTTQTEVEVGDLLVVYVTMGSGNFPAIDVQGVAFGVNLPAALVDSSTVEVEYLESGFLVTDAPYIDLTHQPSDGIIHTVGAKTNSLGSTGAGIIATVSFIVEEDAVGIKANGRSTSKNVGDIIATIEAKDIIIEDSRGFKYALPNTSLDIIVKGENDETPETLNKLNIYPNPSSDRVTVYSDNGAKMNWVNVYSLDGKLMKTINQINSNEVTIDVNNFEKGLYIIKASSNTNTYSTKLIKK